MRSLLTLEWTTIFQLLKRFEQVERFGFGVSNIS
jgi:hypothetical protein